VYLLDTNVVSQILRRKPARPLVDRFLRQPPETLFTSCICVMELRHGAARLNDHGVLWRRIERDVLERLQILPVGVEEAVLAGDILAHLRAIGRPIDVEDVLIGATALRYGLSVVTGNVKHFGRIPNLVVEDWLAAP
jgi:tRNA(fMet)-specific endonuclease VapC